MAGRAAKRKRERGRVREGDREQKGGGKKNWVKRFNVLLKI